PYERGVEATEILNRLLRAEIRPASASVHPPVLLAPQATGTDDLPLRIVHARAAEMEAEEDVISICVMGGFAYADTPDTRASLIVTTHDNPALARQYAQELADL